MTIGHNQVRDIVAAGLSEADPGIIMEAPALVDSRPELRPADILSSGGCFAGTQAIDIGITSPNAGGAIDIGIEKLDNYRDILPELARSGIRYVPLIASCYGRRSEAFSSLLRVAASKAARLRGTSSYDWKVRRWHLCIGVALARRAAHLAMRCLPSEPDGVWLACVETEQGD